MDRNREKLLRKKKAIVTNKKVTEKNLLAILKELLYNY